MEYGVPILPVMGVNSNNDLNYKRHVGYSESNLCIQKLYADETLDIICYKITELLEGVDPRGRPIVVPRETVKQVLDSVYQAYRPPTGDIYGRYNVPTDRAESYVQSIIDQTIEIIVSDVRVNIGMDECNSKLTKWTSVYGDFNNHGLRSHAPIKVRKRRPNHTGFVSFMNY